LVWQLSCPKSFCQQNVTKLLPRCYNVVKIALFTRSVVPSQSHCLPTSIFAKIHDRMKPGDTGDTSDFDLGVTIRGFVGGQKVFGRYVLERILGRGGMGVIWLARDEELDVQVALKFLPDEISKDAEAVACLKRETRRGLELSHPNIVKTYGFSRDDEAAAIAMEYVEGKTLSALKADREERPWFEVEEIAPWILSICQALDYAHNRAKVIHRDLKPINLMLSTAGEIKITDFGVAQVLQDSYSRVSANTVSSAGTLTYMSPQQAVGERPSVADDIYSLGATIYDLLSGRAPFVGNSSTIYIQVRDKVPPAVAERREELSHAGAAIPREWEETVSACLAKDPAQRPKSAMEVAARLGLVQERQAPVPPPPPVKKPEEAHIIEGPKVEGPKVEVPKTELKPPPKPVFGGARGKLAASAALAILLIGGAWAAWRYGVAHGNNGPVVGPQPTPQQSNTARPQASQAPEASNAADTEYKLGRRYVDGDGTASSIDQVEALRHFRNAADQNQPEALAEIGRFYAEGWAGLNKSRTAATTWGQKALAAGLEKRAQDNSPQAEVELAFLYDNGRGVTVDYSKAADLYRQAADQGDGWAQYELGLDYEHGTGVGKDMDKAIELYRKSAAQGFVSGQRALGVCYNYGTGVEKDLSRSAELYQKAADQGDARSQANLGYMYANGSGVDKDMDKAIELYQKAADQGDDVAQNNLGACYDDANGVQRDLAKAFELYRKAADQGNACAQTNLGYMYANGAGVERDLGKAVEYYQKAVDQGFARAQNNLGYLYDRGTGVDRDVNKAIELYQKAADQGYTNAEVNLGYLYEKGNGVPKDLNKAIELYQKAADQGDTGALRNIGVLYANGTGVEKDIDKAVEYYRKAADQGNTDAEVNLGFLHERGDGVEKDLNKAVALYRKAADKGNADAQRNLGVLYENGTGVEKNLSTAAEYFQKAVDQGNSDAEVNLGFMYERGIGVARDLDNAIELYRKAAAQGNAGAQRNLGVLYENGQGVEKDMNKSVGFFQKAADQGDGDAEVNLGVCYENGAGVAADLAKAIALYQKAADQGNAYAQYDLGLCYEHGKGMEKDLPKALDLYQASASQGYADAQAALKRLGHSPSQ